MLNASSLEHIIHTFHGNDLKVICLYRSDALARYVSEKNAQNYTTWRWKNTSHYAVEVKASKFRDDLHHGLDQYASFASILQRYNQTYFSVEYERDIHDHDRLPRVLANIQNYFLYERV